MWTPWEPVPVEIEGDHIVPVMWRDRLNLFWVTFITQANPQSLPADTHRADEVLAIKNAPLWQTEAHSPTHLPSVGTQVGGKPQTLVEMTLGDTASRLASTVTKRNITVLLHWSQYFQGEWSTTESGGMSGALNASVDAGFDANKVFIHVTKELTGDGEEGAVLIHLGAPIGQSFRIVSRNSRPESAGLLAAPTIPYTAPTVLANRRGGTGSLKVSYDQTIVTENGKRTKVVPFAGNIVQGAGRFTLLACANALTIGGPEVAPLVAPVFFHDEAAALTFFVEPAFHEKTIEEWHEYVARTPEPEVEWDQPDWWKDLPLGPSFPKYKLPKLVDQQDPLWRNPIDPRAKFGLDDQVDWMTHAATVVQFGGELVASTGRGGVSGDGWCSDCGRGWSGGSYAGRAAGGQRRERGRVERRTGGGRAGRVRASRAEPGGRCAQRHRRERAECGAPEEPERVRGRQGVRRLDQRLSRGRAGT